MTCGSNGTIAATRRHQFHGCGDGLVGISDNLLTMEARVALSGMPQDQACGW